MHKKIQIPFRWSWTLHILFILLITFWITFYFFFGTKYSSYPWWHQLGNDSDGTYSSVTTALVNGKPLRYVHHPGATIYFLHGAAYRIFPVINPSYGNILKLSEAQNVDEKIEIIEKATHVSRLMVFVTMLIFLILTYSVYHVWTNNPLISFMGCFVMTSSIAIYQHSHKIRPELPSVLFFFMACLFLGLLLKRKTFFPVSILKFLAAIGFCIGFALFSKIQIAGAIIFLLLVMFSYVSLHDKKFLPSDSEFSIIKANFILAVVNLLFFPYWGLKRPSFMDAKFIAALPSSPDFQRVYGPAPETLYAIPLIILFLLALITITSLYRKKNFLPTRIFPFIFMINSLMTGFIISCYLILLPCSTSLSGYLENTQHLIYSTTTNLFFGGFLVHKVVNAETFQILSNVFRYNQIFKINLLYLIIPAVIGCLIRLCLRFTHKKGYYIFILGWFGFGFLMDLLATMRWPNNYMYHHAIYSMSFYVTGLTLWLSAEWDQWGQLKRKYISYGLRVLVSVVILWQIFGGYRFLINQRSRKEIIHKATPQELLFELNQTKTYSTFWQSEEDKR